MTMEVEGSKTGVCEIYPVKPINASDRCLLFLSFSLSLAFCSITAIVIDVCGEW